MLQVNGWLSTSILILLKFIDHCLAVCSASSLHILPSLLLVIQGFFFFSLLLLLQFSRLQKKPCRTRNCSKIPQETWKVKVQKHIQRFVFNRLKYVLSTSLFACHCAHCSFFFFLLCSSQVGMIDIFVKSSLFSVSAEARAVFQRLIFAC